MASCHDNPYFWVHWSFPSPWHSMEGNYTRVFCTGPLSLGLQHTGFASTTFFPWIPSTTSGAGNMLSSISYCLRGVPRGLTVPPGEELSLILSPCFPLPRTTRTISVGGRATIAKTGLHTESLPMGKVFFNRHLCCWAWLFASLRWALSISGGPWPSQQIDPRHNHSTSYQTRLGMVEFQLKPATGLPQEEAIHGLPLNANSFQYLRIPLFFCMPCFQIASMVCWLKMEFGAISK